MAPMASKYATLGVEHLRDLVSSTSRPSSSARPSTKAMPSSSSHDHRPAPSRPVAPDGHAPVGEVLEVPPQHRADVVEREPGGDLVGQPVGHELDGLVEGEVRLLAAAPRA